jgi:hypothetical protein
MGDPNIVVRHHHDPCLLDDDGRVLATRRIADGLEGLAALHALALADRRARCGVGRATTRNRFVGAIGDLNSDRAPTAN